MFDVLVYHESPIDAERAAEKALDEVVRLDRVLSHFAADNDLARLVREGRTGFVRVDRSLYDVLQESVRISRLSAGKFDVTIAPLVGVWKHARGEGRRPSDTELAAAQRCVGFEKIQTREPDSVRFVSDCVGLDLGGIGKGYAVDRAMAVLQSSGITRALVNAGSSSIAALGSPPNRMGWPVSLGLADDGPALTLRNSSISTSRQSDQDNGEIVDPQTGLRASNRSSISVLAPSATVSDALSTTVLMLSVAEAKQVLSRFEGATAFWLSGDGRVQASYPESARTSGSR